MTVDLSTWGRYVPVVIDKDEVGANETDFPVVIDYATLAATTNEMFDADGSYPAINGGGDIRFVATVADLSSVTLLNCEVVSFVTDNTPTNGSCEIWVKIPSLSSSVDTTIYCVYNKAAVSQPAVDAEGGSEGVYKSEYKIVQHLSEDPSGSAPQMIDSSSNDIDGTSEGTMTSGDLVSGKIGNCLDFDGSDDNIDFGSPAALKFTNEDFSVSCWFKFTGSSFPSHAIPISKGDPAGYSPWAFWINSGTLKILVGNSALNGWLMTSSLSHSLSVDTWYHAVWTKNGTAVKLYIDGSEVDSYTMSSDTIGDIDSATFKIGCGSRLNNNYSEFEGLVDDSFVIQEELSSTWIATSYSNQNAPSTFAQGGAAVSIGGVSDLSIDINDTMTIAESIAAVHVGNLFTSIIDTMSIVENIDTDLPLSASVVDTVSMSEALGKTLPLAGININDTPNMVEFLSVLKDIMPNIFDTMSIAEFVSVATDAISAITVDTISVTEFVSILIELNPSVFDAMSIAEYVDVDIAGVQNLTVSISDVMSLVEVLSVIRDITPSISDVVSINEYVFVIKDILPNITDAVNIVEFVNAVMTSAGEIYITDAFNIVENISVVMSSLLRLDKQYESFCIVSDGEKFHIVSNYKP